MRSSTRTYVASALLGSTLVSAVPQRLERFRHRGLDPEIGIASGEADPNHPYVPNTDTPAVSADAVATSTNPNPTPVQNPATTASSQIHDTVTDHSTTSASIRSMSGSQPNTLDTAYTAAAGASSSSSFNVASAPSVTPSLSPEPPADSNNSGRGVLTGVVAGGLVLAFLLLTLGLWFCYRRRGPRSGSSTPIYTTKVVSGDDDSIKKPNPILAFFRGRSSQWKKGHHRVQSSMSFASPMIENEPKMVAEQGAFTRAPLAPHLGGGVTGGAGSMRGGSSSARGSGSAKSGGNASSARDTWNNGRWSTFSTSDGSVYPQTPTNNNNRLSGIIMETVVESDATSLPQTPTIAARSPPIDYADLKRSSSNDAAAAVALLNRTPKKNTSLVPSLPPLGTNRLSMFREEDSGTPTTPTSSGGLTFGSGSNYARTIDRNSHPVPPPPALSTLHGNSSGSLRSGGPLVNAVPKFNPAHSNGSGGSLTSTGRESAGTIRITNPFLDDEDGLSSYGHGLLEATNNDDSRSIRTMDSDAFGAYPSSTGCIDKRPGPSPSPDAAPLTRPRSSLISDASSDYPYPLGYAVDSDGNVANPFLRISEILEEVDGRMRWPSPPLLHRAESRNY